MSIFVPAMDDYQAKICQRNLVNFIQSPLKLVKLVGFIACPLVCKLLVKIVKDSFPVERSIQKNCFLNLVFIY